MADRTRERRFAILIDADNASHRIAAGLFEEVAKFGEASVRRIYGDFANPRLKSWAEILPKYAIDPIQQFPYTSGKNACDIALTIDAMDLLHSGRFDGFCQVSSETDFTRLASRLREQGLDIYGFGAQKTPESFRQACRRFIYTEILLPEAPGAAPRAALDAKAIPAFGTEDSTARGTGCHAGESARCKNPSCARRGRADFDRGHRGDGRQGWVGRVGRSGAAPFEDRP